MKKAIILVPGYGAIVKSSREIIFAYQWKFQRDESDLMELQKKLRYL